MEVKVVAHTSLFYWWPVWALAFLFAILTAWQGVTLTIGGWEQKFHPNKNLGVFFTLVMFLVVVMTNVALRGLASVIFIVSALCLTLFFAYMGWWEDILYWLGQLAIHQNLGFYVVFGTALFVAWVTSLFIFDRLDYWVFRPGQAVHYQFFGGGARTYDTQGMSVFKLRDDMFRHWILGLGSGDLHVSAAGAKKDEFVLHNVLFIGSKVDKIQQLVAMKPDEARDMVTTGGPS